MEEVEEFVYRTLEAIREQSEHVDITVPNEVDQICFALSRSSSEIGEILNAVLITQAIALVSEPDRYSLTPAQFSSRAAESCRHQSDCRIRVTQSSIEYLRVKARTG